MVGYLEEVYLPDNIHEYSVDFIPMSNNIKLNFLHCCECTHKIESKPSRTLGNSATSVIWKQQLVCLLGALIWHDIWIPCNLNKRTRRLHLAGWHDMCLCVLFFSFLLNTTYPTCIGIIDMRTLYKPILIMTCWWGEWTIELSAWI